MTVVTRKKLIEVALPLEAINAEASARKRKAPAGYPTVIHKWWAQRPIAAARAVIFSQMVDDPSSVPEEFPTEEAQDVERQRLFRLIEQLVLWENTTNETVLQAARDEIWRSWRRACADNKDHPQAAKMFNPEKLPAFHDPFAGGGSLPLEAQRLGMEAYASDLNPVAVLINKAMIEIPPKFAGMAPVNPESRAGRGSTSAAWKGAAGLAEDVRYYGKWMRDEAEKRIGHLYPKVPVTPEMVAERPDLKPYEGKELTVIAWLWARTVKSPNPAYANVDVPLVSTFVLSSKAGKEVYVDPVVSGNSYRFEVRTGTQRNPDAYKNGTKLSRANFRCLLSGVPIEGDYIKAEGKANRLGTRLMAIVAEGSRGRVYLSPTPRHEEVPNEAEPDWVPTVEIATRMTGGNCTPYGLVTFGDLFTKRQLVALTTLSDLVVKIREQVRTDARAAMASNDNAGLDAGGRGATAYADAVAVLLTFGVSRAADYNSTISTWRPKDGAMRSTLAKQAIPMTWDFAEASPFAKSSGGFTECVSVVASVLANCSAYHPGFAFQENAVQSSLTDEPKVVSTDPPYYDNVGYADLSDFFYVWERRSLGTVLPSLFSTVGVPKNDELIASRSRHKSAEQAASFFTNGMTRAMTNIKEHTHSTYPITVYYAFKQTENGAEGESIRTGWETFLEALLQAGLSISGTWPMRTEGDNRQAGIDSNALASSIVLVCHPRPVDAISVTRSDFLQELSIAIREALPVMTSGQLAPVDLAQASIGPGIAVYSKYADIRRQDGERVTVREALQDINSAVWDFMWERASSFDARTRFCLMFFNDSGFTQTDFDVATKYARTLGVGVDTVENENLLVAEHNRAWLAPISSYPEGVEGLERAFRGSAWEACMRLAVTLQEQGEGPTAALAQQLGEGICARARELAVWLYTIADSHKRTQDALFFNALDASWPEIQQLMAENSQRGQQGNLI